MLKIRLARGEWEYDPAQLLGPAGGFGEVFVGQGPGLGGVGVAVKRLKISANDAAHREMRIAEELAGREFRHVIKVFDAGQDAESDTYFVVMARAEGSLQETIRSRKRFDDLAAVQILLQILSGLEEVPEIVHRDLKPGNVLYHAGVWKIADFGIARFVEESTSARTLNHCLSPHYAAPEQWRHERATSATDLYALGCIAYALLTGSPPFSGIPKDELKDRHLNVAPPPVNSIDPRLRSLLAMLLRKNQDSRPSRARVRNILEEVRLNPTRQGEVAQPLNELAATSAELARRDAEFEAFKRSVVATARERANIFEEGIRVLRDEIVIPLLDEIARSAPNSKVGREQLYAAMGAGTLSVVLGMSPVSASAFPVSKWEVFAAATIAAAQSSPDYRWEAALWFGRVEKDGDLRWYEVSYMDNPARMTRRPWAPFALNDDSEIGNADQAAGPAIGMYQIAFGPNPIDGEDYAAFRDRWITLFTRASKKELTYPRALPLPHCGY